MKSFWRRRGLNLNTHSINRNRMEKIVLLSYLFNNISKDMQPKFRIGVTTSQAIFLDLEPKEKARKEMDQIIKYIWNMIGRCKVLILETSKGYHLVFGKKIDLKTFKKVYGSLISNMDKFESIDLEHVYCSRKYLKTTLRISPKMDKKIGSPKKVLIIDSN